EPTAYWFANFASRVPSDIFWFCREGDTTCPFDAEGGIDHDSVVGLPIFSRIPGAYDYSPFWLIWVVHVPADYQPNEIKSAAGLERASTDGRVRIDQAFYDFGGETGPDLAIMHCLMVLDETALQHNNSALLNEPDTPTYEVPLLDGWHNQYQVKWYDFSATDGIFAPDPGSESVPLMPFADIFIFFRDCAGGSDSIACEWVGSDEAAVSERGMETDINADGDKEDTNNVISGFPGITTGNSLDRAYSPLWRINQALVVAEHDDEVSLIDTTGDQNESVAMTTQDVRDLLAAGLIEINPLMEEEAGNAIPGNDGMLFFNCPSQIPLQ
ncbi:MAG: hypothetical protein JRJ84_24320, partial [Deltaproteobacteria bacterium]|nr:hypothetical protein [Deltaproteobacteria bacterium]